MPSFLHLLPPLARFGALLVLLATAGPAPAAGPAAMKPGKIVAKWLYDAPSGQNEIKVNLRDAYGYDDYRGGFDRRSPALTDRSRFQLYRIADGTLQPVPIARVVLPDLSTPEGNVPSVLLEPAPGQTPQAGAAYTLSIAPNAHGPGLIPRTGGPGVENPFSVAVEVPDVTAPTLKDRQSFKPDLKLEDGNFLSLLAGKDHGALVSGKIAADFFRNQRDRVFLRGQVKADVDLGGGNPRSYFNNVEGELGIVLVPFTNQLSTQFRLQSKLEADQSFSTINEVLSLGAWFQVNNPVTATISQAVFFLNPAAPGHPGQRLYPLGPAPIIFLGYDHTFKLTTGSGDAARTETTSDHRLSATLDWPLWIARGIDLTGTPLKSVYGLQLILDLTPKFDLGERKLFPEEKITLALQPDGTPNDPTPKRPSLVLTYANGKATPTFKHVDTLLGGLRLPF